MKKIFFDEDIPGFSINRFLALHGTEKIFAEVEFLNPVNQQSQVVFIPISDLQSTRLKAYIPGFFAIPHVLPEDKYKFIALKINDEWSSQSKPLDTMVSQGYNRIDNKWVYAIGNTIINAEESMTSYPFRNFDLAHKARLDNSWIWVERFCLSGNPQAALLLCSLTPLLFPITKALHLPDKVVHAYVLGRSGCGKTSFSGLLTSAFGYSGVNLGSKKNKIFENLTAPNVPLLADDLNKSKSEREYQRKLQTVCETISAISSGGTFFIDDGSLSLDQSSLILTSEILIDVPSKINRMVLVNFNDNLKTEDLNFLQQKFNHYKNFLYHFIFWICQNHEALTKQIEAEDKKLCFDLKVAHDKASKYIGFSRIAHSNKLLKITGNIVIRFLQENNIPEKNLKTLISVFKQSIEGTISDTLAYVKTSPSGSPVIDFIIDVFAYDNNEIIAEDYEEYMSSKKISVFEKLFFRYKQKFLFRANEVADYISAKSSTDISSSDLIKELSKANLLAYNKEGYYPHLPKKIRETYGDQKRYSRLNLEILSGLVEEQYSEFTDYLNSPIKDLQPLKN